ncbi:MAG: ABC transporter ATP-binding protein [Clostridiales bacterium]|nr:ABC transporter ATP-binding protein [Eubacteriales bacterium]MDH7566212.1 ABC transporter ATP-binding protein [Clostridiales bacterium]
MEDQAVLSIRDLRTYFYDSRGNVAVKAVDGVDIDVYKGRITALVGESGCGKSITSLSVLGLIERPGKIVSGQVLLKGRDIRKCSREEMRGVRGREISMVFQDPYAALNPVMKIGWQLSEAILAHEKVSGEEARERSLRLLQKVGLDRPEKIMKSYTFQLSGGMCQRVMIAIAMASNPSVLIADEPTTALDLTIQAEILEELNRLKKESGMGVLLITHDLGVVAEMADDVYVMKAGKIVEKGSVYGIFENPRHSYTKELLGSIS